MRRRRMMLAWLGSALVVGAALVWATGLAAAPAAALAGPLIASAQVSEDQTTLTVTGLNFAPAPAANGDAGLAPRPGVSLALTPLPVTASAATSVTATLPSPLAAGTYLLLLSRSDEQAATFYVTVGAVGPRGPAGPAAVGTAGAVWQ